MRKALVLYTKSCANVDHLYLPKQLLSECLILRNISHSFFTLRRYLGSMKPERQGHEAPTFGRALDVLGSGVASLICCLSLRIDICMSCLCSPHQARDVCICMYTHIIYTCAQARPNRKHIFIHTCTTHFCSVHDRSFLLGPTSSTTPPDRQPTPCAFFGKTTHVCVYGGDMELVPQYWH